MLLVCDNYVITMWFWTLPCKHSVIGLVLASASASFLRFVLWPACSQTLSLPCLSTFNIRPSTFKMQSFVCENEIYFIKYLCNSKKMITFAAELCRVLFASKKYFWKNIKNHDKRIQKVSWSTTFFQRSIEMRIFANFICSRRGDSRSILQPFRVIPH